VPEYFSKGSPLLSQMKGFGFDDSHFT
jgi:hypothetical protein